MPSHPEPDAVSSKSRAPLHPDEPDPSLFPEQAPGARATRKKSKYATNKRTESTDRVPEPEVTRDPSPLRGQSILGQIPRSFPTSARQPLNDDLLEEFNTAEKASDQYTPPQKAFVPEPPYARSPRLDLISGLHYAHSPPPQHAFTGKGGFNSRSPPTSPPQTKSRPVSYGGPPSSYGYPRMSTSPYGRPIPGYGSPPALPHLPQQHFYNPQDINLGVGPRPDSARSQPPTFLKFGRSPGSSLQSPEVLFAGYDTHLDFLSYDGENFTHIGSLPHLPGTVQDAVFLTWSSGHDPFAELRPLVALVLVDQKGPGPGSHHWRPSQTSSYEPGSAAATFDDSVIPTTTVVVYSLRNQTCVAELLRVSANTPQLPNMGIGDIQTPSKHPLSLQSSGNVVIVSSGLSGEIFVFGVRDEGSVSRFGCIIKLWTSLQPHAQRRDSSHTRGSEAEPSPADAFQVQHLELRPMLSLNGRWLAYCPTAVTSTSIGAVLGESVFTTNNSNFASRGAPSRPTVNCEVESPDVETLLSKVAKGAAQSIVRGSKWLGEMGLQAWRNWNQEALTNTLPQPTHRSPVYSPQLAAAQFPPTHGEAFDTSAPEPELVSIVDLLSLPVRDGNKTSEPPLAFATFNPPGGCSFLSFAPNGLCLLTASKKGDVQYIWDLLQVRYARTTVLPETESGNFPARVRQIVKYERFSPSMTVDVMWESPLGHRFATLTQNRTIHMFDLPFSAVRWPPARKAKKPRPISAAGEKSDAIQQAPTPTPTGFLASAMNFASNAQPMLANLRGRAPSVGGGVSGIGVSSMGLASATGMRGGKVVAAGFSKSLGAASDTVAHIRHAGQSKLHLKAEAVPGRLVWRRRGQRTTLCVLEPNGVKVYYVRKTNPRERQLETVSVFDARKAMARKLPENLGPKLEQPSVQDNVAEQNEVEQHIGFWKSDLPRGPAANTLTAPLSFAEIETNSPYQPFHSDHRVTMSVYADESQIAESQMPTVSVMFQPQSQISQPQQSTPSRWVFGGAVSTTKLNVTPQREESAPQTALVYRETTMAMGSDDNTPEQIVSTTRRLKTRKTAVDQPGDADGAGIVGDQDDFFEDELEVLDFAADRV